MLLAVWDSSDLGWLREVSDLLLDVLGEGAEPIGVGLGPLPAVRLLDESRLLWLGELSEVACLRQVLGQALEGWTSVLAVSGLQGHSCLSVAEEEEGAVELGHGPRASAEHLLERLEGRSTGEPVDQDDSVCWKAEIYAQVVLLGTEDDVVVGGVGSALEDLQLAIILDDLDSCEFAAAVCEASDLVAAEEDDGGALGDIGGGLVEHRRIEVLAVGEAQHIKDGFLDDEVDPAGVAWVDQNLGRWPDLLDQLLRVVRGQSGAEDGGEVAAQ